MTMKKPSGRRQKLKRSQPYWLYSLLLVFVITTNTSAFEPHNAMLFISPGKHRPKLHSRRVMSSKSNSLSIISISRGGSLASIGDHESYDFGSKKMKQVLEELSTDIEHGLSSQEASERLVKYGENVLVSPPGKNLLELILEQFEDRLVQILLCVAALSAVFSYFEMGENVAAGDATGGFIKSFAEPLIILAILVLNAAVGVWQSKSAEGSLDALKKMQPTLATVLRNGEWLDDIDASLLVPGDIISVRVGDKIPADGRLISLKTSTISLDEGSLTGESVTTMKLPGDEGISLPNSPIQDQRGLVFSGSMVTSGSGLVVVVETGMNTEIGKIQKGVVAAKEEDHKTPLAIKLDEFGNTLTLVIGVICVAVWVVSIPKFSDPSFSSAFEGAVYYAKVAVALGVAAIPEGLPAVITLCLSLGTRRMAQRNVIVRKLPSVETLGCTSVICTDKTGTLTTNEMTAVSLVVLESDGSREGAHIQEYAIEGSGYSPVGSVESVLKTESTSNPNGSIADICAVSALCNDAKIITKCNESSIGFERVGEPTEAALIALTEKLGDVPLSEDTAMGHSLQWQRAWRRTFTLEFSRDRKSMGVLCRLNGNNRSGNRLLVKGAPNLLINRCTHVKLRNGKVVKLTGALRRVIEEKTSELASRPLRMLGLAVKETEYLDRSLKQYNGIEPQDETEHDSIPCKHPLLDDPSKYSSIESGLTLVGLVGIKDPARPEVAESIKTCSDAGIRVIMITGDAKDTAIAIAKDVNIFTEDAHQMKAFEGREFFLKDKEEQLDLLRHGNLVFCRAEPADKQLLVQMLQSLHEIPAMTGDGVNDAPALQQSAIGIAMGITGTEVAKEASDMILVDDNFSSIVNAVEEGRCIYANMQAFICFLISCNIGEIFTILLATLAGFPEPLTAMHLLWVNLVTDGPPATALGFNPPTPDAMTQRPRPVDEPIMSKWLLTRYCVTGFYVGLATVGVFVNHYLSLGISLADLSSWSKCGIWGEASGLTPEDCERLFEGVGRALPQTLALTTLVCMEMIKALSAVSVDSSIFTVPPTRNKWLLLGVAIPMTLHLAVVYSEQLGFPAIGESFGLVPLSMGDWVNIFKFAGPILIVDEILKAIGRRVNAKQQLEESIEKC